MNCYKHTETEAQGICVYCGKPFCAACLVEVMGRMYCKEHVSSIFEEMKVSSPKTSAPVSDAVDDDDYNAVIRHGYGADISPLRLRNAGNDILFCFLTLGIYAFYVLFSIKQSIEKMESTIDLKQTAGSFSNAGKLVLAIFAIGLLPSVIAPMASMNANPLVLLPYVLLVVMWLLTRSFRKRLDIIAYGLGFEYIEEPGWWVIISSNWLLMAVLFAFVVVFGPFVALFRTIKKYNEIVIEYNDAIE